MALTKTVYNGAHGHTVITLTGNTADIGQALANERVQTTEILANYFNGTVQTVIYTRH